MKNILGFVYIYILLFIRVSNNDGRVEAYHYHERMSDDGGEDEADHEERRKHCGLILL